LSDEQLSRVRAWQTVVREMKANSDLGCDFAEAKVEIAAAQTANNSQKFHIKIIP
jgi:hypothetical protein